MTLRNLMNQEIEGIIEKLDLTPHPEGGYFKETYRSEGLIDKKSLDTKYSGNRNYSTSIYFLLTSGAFSAFHKIHQDEVWHFYSGSPILLHMIDQEGHYSKVAIGGDLNKDETPQFIVQGGVWFASEVKNENSYSLVGCTVAPGFDFDDFELGKRDEMLQKFTRHKSIINRLTRL